jgi:hypothetical protein
MAGKQAVKLYWCTTDDHDEDWFIFASSARQARAYHENYEGYGKGDAGSRLIIADVPLQEFENGKPPCHAQMPDLLKLGFKDAGSVLNLRRVEYQGKIFEEGILESMVEAGRKNLTLVHVENGSLELRAKTEEAASDELDACEVGAD